MNSFDNVHTVENNFVKHNSETLFELFGTDNLTSLWLADMDFTIAKPISDEIKRIADRGIYAYEFDANILYNTLIDWYQRRHQLQLHKGHFIQVTGVLTGISILLQELTNPHDGVLIQTPVYHQFAHLIKSNNRKVVSNPLQLVNGRYRMDLNDLEQKLQNKSIKIILLCNPHNPIGRVWGKLELQALINLAKAYNVTIISDEIHSDIIYSGNTFTSVLSFKETKHIALLGSPAKTFGMQSIASGYLYVLDKAVKKRIQHKVESMYLNRGNAFSNYATIAAYKYGDEWVNNLITYLEETISWIRHFLKEELPEVSFLPVEGTYQLWLDFRKLNLTKDELNELIVDKAKLGLAMGTWFGREGCGFARITIASPLSKIQTAFRKLSAAIKG